MGRIEYLESLLPNKECEDKHWNNFSKYTCYIGNGIYEWRGRMSADPRELFLMGVLDREKVKFKEL